MPENSSWLIRQFVILGVSAIALIITALFSMKRAFDSRIQKNKIKQRYNLIPLVCVAVVLLSWITNFGFLRLKLTVQAVPVLHALVFLLINLHAAKKADNSKKLRTALNVMYITYVAAYVLMPDIPQGDDVYAFFGLIENSKTVIKICNSIYPVFFTVNIIFIAVSGIIAVYTKEKFTLPQKKKSNYKGGKNAK